MNEEKNASDYLEKLQKHAEKHGLCEADRAYLKRVVTIAREADEWRHSIIDGSVFEKRDAMYDLFVAALWVSRHCKGQDEFGIEQHKKVGECTLCQEIKKALNELFGSPKILDNTKEKCE